MTFAVERWSDFLPDFRNVMHEHWRELAVDQEQIPLVLNEEKYAEMDASGILHILAAREGAELAGYFLAFVLPHIHYSTSGPMAFTDIYFMRKEFRKGANGVRLFTEAECSLKRRGVTKIYLSTKVHLDNSRLFEYLGWKLTDKAFTKLVA